jgi:hypothetical protein
VVATRRKLCSVEVIGITPEGLTPGSSQVPTLDVLIFGFCTSAVGTVIHTHVLLVPGSDSPVRYVTPQFNLITPQLAVETLFPVMYVDGDGDLVDVNGLHCVKWYEFSREYKGKTICMPNVRCE